MFIFHKWFTLQELAIDTEPVGYAHVVIKLSLYSPLAHPIASAQLYISISFNVFCETGTSLEVTARTVLRSVPLLHLLRYVFDYNAKINISR